MEGKSILLKFTVLRLLSANIIIDITSVYTVIKTKIETILELEMGG
jgi:hypothetical protein